MRVNKLRVPRCVALFAAFVVSGSLLMAPSAQATNSHDVVVTLDKRAHNPYLVASKVADQPIPMPWFGGKHLAIRFS